MAFSKITKDMNIIAALDDEPNDVGGLSAAQLKAKFDEGGLALKTFINNLIDAIAAGTAAANIGAKDLNDEATDLQTALDNLAGAVIGTLPDGSVTTAKLHDGAVTTAKIADDAVTDAKVDWATSGIARVEVLTYTGTGVYGSWANANSLTLEHEPKIVFIYSTMANILVGIDTWQAILFWDRLKKGFADYPNDCAFNVLYSSNNRNRYRLSNGNKTIEWYTTQGAGYNPYETQLNVNAFNYAVISFY